MFLTKIILAEKDYSSYGLNTLGPLCLWQCFYQILPIVLILGRVICRSDSGVGLFGLLCIPGVAFLFAYYAFHPGLSGVMQKGYFPENRSQTVQMKMQVWIYLPTMQLILIQAI